MKIQPDMESHKPVIVRVIVNIPINDGQFDYEIPEEFRSKILPGCMVAVPFQKEMMQGIVWALDVLPEKLPVRRVDHIIDESPVLTNAQMRLAEILSERCLAPLSDCVNLLLTEKIRKISQTQYFLIDEEDNSSVSQSSFFPDEKKIPVRDRILELFTNKYGVLTPDILAKTFGKTNWRNAMDVLINKGAVRKETIFTDVSDVKPKRIRVVSLTADTQKIAEVWETLSRDPFPLERRQAVIRFLRENPGENPISEITKQTRATLSDLNSLKKRELISINEMEVWRDYEPELNENYPSQQITLNTEQLNALKIIQAGIGNEAGKIPILLHGVTGSGKTEIYLQAAEKVLQSGRQVLVFVPEIALTPQILNRFQKRFPGITGIYHSRLSDGERYDTWRRGRSGQFRIIVGPRSALSVPLQDPGLIIVDECHDDSYYQTEGMPFFSAVQAAADYARICNAQLILGSATPTTAQVYKAEQSGWKIIKLTSRATGVSQPVIRLIDMRQELKAGNRSVLSRQLSQELSTTLSMGKQSILFLNRRGSASYTFCHFCGFDFRCPKCEIPMTWHNQQKQLVCHFCGFTQQQPDKCPQCNHHEIRRFGTGVEQVEEILSKEFPDARVIRMDADTTARKGDHERILAAFAKHEAEILIGTKMVAKGLDFPDVRLVGIILADVGTNFHDYRVDEHTYQMLTQVAGRAGRADNRGLAILQTFQPDRYSIRAVVAGNYDDFYSHEIRFRREIGYPPFSRMVRLEISDPDSAKAEQRSLALAEELRKIIGSEKFNATKLIGPAPCFFPRLNGKYRWHIILRGPDPVSVVREIDRSRIRVEVDPPSVL